MKWEGQRESDNVEDMRDSPNEVAVPLTTDGAGTPVQGRRYVASFTYGLSIGTSMVKSGVARTASSSATAFAYVARIASSSATAPA